MSASVTITREALVSLLKAAGVANVDLDSLAVAAPVRQRGADGRFLPAGVKPAKARKAKARKAGKAPQADSEFVLWLRKTAPARHARKASNKEMAEWCRSHDLLPNGAVWKAVKGGERNLQRLRAL